MKKINQENGRSMVEMLGVLAIIGVLSIGGIAGYTMAMNRYKANQILDQAIKLSIGLAQAFDKDISTLKAKVDGIANETGVSCNNYPGAELRGPVICYAYETTFFTYPEGDVEVFVPNQKGLHQALLSIVGKGTNENYANHIIVISEN